MNINLPKPKKTYLCQMTISHMCWGRSTPKILVINSPFKRESYEKGRYIKPYGIGLMTIPYHRKTHGSLDFHQAWLHSYSQQRLTLHGKTGGCHMTCTASGPGRAENMGVSPENCQKTQLVGGFNPSEKCWSNWIISANRGESKKYLKPPPSQKWRFWKMIVLYFEDRVIFGFHVSFRGGQKVELLLPSLGSWVLASKM